MPLRTIEDYVEHADKLLEEVSGAWCLNVSTGHGADLTADFKALDVTAQQYRTAKQVADNHRDTLRLVRRHTDEALTDIDSLREQAVSHERATREAFAKACKEYEEKHFNGEAAKAGK